MTLTQGQGHRWPWNLELLPISRTLSTVEIWNLTHRYYVTSPFKMYGLRSRLQGDLETLKIWTFADNGDTISSRDMKPNGTMWQALWKRMGGRSRSQSQLGMLINWTFTDISGTMSRRVVKLDPKVACAQTFESIQVRMTLIQGQVHREGHMHCEHVSHSGFAILASSF